MQRVARGRGSQRVMRDPVRCHIVKELLVRSHRYSSRTNMDATSRDAPGGRHSMHTMALSPGSPNLWPDLGTRPHRSHFMADIARLSVVVILPCEIIVARSLASARREASL